MEVCAACRPTCTTLGPHTQHWQSRYALRGRAYNYSAARPEGTPIQHVLTCENENRRNLRLKVRACFTYARPSINHNNMHQSTNSRGPQRMTTPRRPNPHDKGQERGRRDPWKASQHKRGTTTRNTCKPPKNNLPPEKGAVV